MKIHNSAVDCILVNRNVLYSGSHDKMIKKTEIGKWKVSGELVGHEKGIWSMDICD